MQTVKVNAALVSQSDNLMVAENVHNSYHEVVLYEKDQDQVWGFAQSLYQGSCKTLVKDIVISSDGEVGFTLISPDGVQTFKFVKSLKGWTVNNHGQN